MAGKILGTTVYYDADCNLSKLEGKKITVLRLRLPRSCACIELERKWYGRNNRSSRWLQKLGSS